MEPQESDLQTQPRRTEAPKRMRSRSSLINRNVVSGRGRTSMRLEAEVWDALGEICVRERVREGELVRRIDATVRAGSRTSAVRTFVLNYYRTAATDEGHAAAGHGQLLAES